MGTQHATGFGYGILVSAKELEKVLTLAMQQQLEEGYVDCELPEVLGYDKVAGESVGNSWTDYRFVFFGIKSTMVEDYDYFTPAVPTATFTDDELTEFNTFLAEVRLQGQVQGWRAWSYEG